jgi:uncharacterized protein (DUF1800 family)
MQHLTGLLGYGVVVISLLLSGCGGSKTSDSAPDPSQSAGQVAASIPNQIGFYAASRFAEQASFGPTTALVAELRQKGFERWIDEQFALPASLGDMSRMRDYTDPPPSAQMNAYRETFPNIAVAGADQLRARVTWSLSQFIVVSQRKVDLIGEMVWINLLQAQGLGNYADLLYALSISPAMGVYLDNNQNRPKSTECPHCAPNENFARELMQLFSLGVFQLNADGTPVRDAKGKFVETYSQRDVEELARVLTGWQLSNEPPNRPNRNYGNWEKPMVPSTWPPERDSGSKTVMGRTFAAGQSQEQDLRSAVSMLMEHPNIAPFVSLRMIQHLVKSNPTPAYVGRVAAKFRNNGQGVSGDMKAVVKAALLDSEARAGDKPELSRADDGKFREPYLHNTALWRGLNCKRVPRYPWGDGTSPVRPPQQGGFEAESVFGYYAPTDRAPGSNLLAPEQKLANASEFTERLNLANARRWNDTAQRNDLTVFDAAGCDVATITTAYALSPRMFNDYLSEHFFRGAMPPTLRSNIEQLIKQPQWDTQDPSEGAMRLLDFALTSPYHGVIK